MTRTGALKEALAFQLANRELKNGPIVFLHTSIVAATVELGNILLRSWVFTILFGVLSISRSVPWSGKRAGKQGDGKHRLCLAAQVFSGLLGAFGLQNL